MTTENTENIDWQKVSERLRCPICGEKAHIDAGTDGTQGFHTHYFPISREMARRLSRGSAEELKEEIASLEKELAMKKQHLMEAENEAV